MSGSQERSRQDQRRVQTAVLGTPDSDQPAFMPLDQEEAEDFQDQARRGSATFWCGTLLGGCGSKLVTKIYRARKVVPHFAHQVTAHQCVRQALAADSADHLYAARHLHAWAQGQGSELGARYFGDFEHGGGCEQLVLENEGGARIRVVFAPRLSAELRELAAAEGAATQWLVRDNPSLVRVLLERGAAFHRFRLAPRALERSLELGTVDAAGGIGWRPVEEAVFSGGRLLLRPPAASSAAGAGKKPAGEEPPAAAPQSRLRTALRGLEHALEHGSRKDVGDFSDRVRRLLAGPREQGQDQDRERARRLLERTASALGTAAPADDTGTAQWRRQVQEREARARDLHAVKQREQDRERAVRRRRVEHELRRVEDLQGKVKGLVRELRTAWKDADWDTYRSTRAYLVRLSRMHTTPGKVEGQIRNALKDLPDLEPSHQPRRQSPPLRKVEPEMKFLWPPRKDPEA